LAQKVVCWFLGPVALQWLRGLGQLGWLSRRRVLEAVFILLEPPSPSRRIFISSHSLPPLWFAVSVLQRFSMSTDGVNPFGNQSSTHSTWPIVLSLYNLPPWLCKKQKYMMMIILVPGPKQPSDRIDVYLRPLVDDLKILWKPGVPKVWAE
jgi:hypothetical protein